MTCINDYFVFLEEEAVIRGRKGKKRTFFCLPHALSESVPPFRDWTRLIGYGVGQMVIQVHNDAVVNESNTYICQVETVISSLVCLSPVSPLVMPSYYTTYSFLLTNKRLR